MAESAAGIKKGGISPPNRICFVAALLAARSYKADFTAVTQALQVAVIEPTSSELDNELDLTICWVCFILPKPMNMSTVK